LFTFESPACFQSVTVITRSGETMTTAASPFLSDTVETDYVDGPNARYAYRRFGKAGVVPLVLCMRFRGTMDHWDPALLELLATEREVIIFDNIGTAATTGTTPTTVRGLGDGAVQFIQALGLSEVDLFGWSLGGYVAQIVALDRPHLVRRLVLAGTGPDGVPDQPPPPDKVWQIAPKPVLDDEDHLYLLYPESDTARAAGLASLRRLDYRLNRSHAEVSPHQVQAQIATLRAHCGLWDRVSDLRLPVLVANGAHDVMIHAYASYAMSQRLPNGKIVLYSDAGHGFLFQHCEDFGCEVLEFLR
jgi:pimeloyl-ACP methyl ester carboxylesterase